MSPSHNAKGPEIEPRHRLVPAVGIMRLVVGEARLLRQWSFACIGGTNVCFVCDLRCWWHGMAAVCVRHSDVSVAWASLGCKCLFAIVGEAVALGCGAGMGRCMRGEGSAG